MAIDIGAGTSDWNSCTSGDGRTFIDLTNPANANGTLTTMSMRAESGCSNVYGGVFSGSGTDYTERSNTGNLGNISAYAVGTFTGLTLNTALGDFIGVYCQYGTWSMNTSSGSGVLRYTGNAMDAKLHTYTSVDADGKLALYGSGTEAAAAFLKGVMEHKFIPSLGGF